VLAHGTFGSLDELLIIGVPVGALLLFDRAVRKRRRQAALDSLRLAKGPDAPATGNDSPAGQASDGQDPGRSISGDAGVGDAADKKKGS
jgi:hypothetical protein